MVNDVLGISKEAVVNAKLSVEERTRKFYVRLLIGMPRAGIVASTQYPSRSKTIGPCTNKSSARYGSERVSSAPWNGEALLRKRIELHAGELDTDLRSLGFRASN